MLDFESYFNKDYSLSKISIIEYLFDPRFELTGIGTKRYGTDSRFHGGPKAAAEHIRWLQRKFGINFEYCVVVVANDKFDISILYHKFGIDPSYVIDIQHLDRHVEARARHSVEKMAERWNTTRKTDELKDLKGKYWKDLNSEEKKLLEQYTLNDINVEEELLTLLLPMLTRPEVELPLARITLDMFLKPKFKVDVDKARDIWLGYRDDMNCVLREVGHPKETISGNIAFKNLLCDALGDEEPPMKRGKPNKDGSEKWILAVSKDDTGRDYLLTHSNPTVRRLMKARIEVKSTPLHQSRVTRIVNQSKPLKGYLPVPLIFNTAHTGRWGGGQWINLQNLPLELKLLLVAPEGYVIVQADQAQIEARMLPYFAGQDDLIEDFRNGVDVYSNFAQYILDKPVRKPRPTDPKPVAKLMKTRRQFGKVGILACGYGMGGDKCFNYMQTNPMVAPDLAQLIEDGTITLGFAKKLVNTYRVRYKKIPQFWGTLEKAFKFVVRYPDKIKELKCGVKFWVKGSTVFMQLPSGRVMRYQDVSIDDNDISWKWGYLWGGVLAENLVQAASRDLIAENILALDKVGVKTALTVHDSILSVVPVDRQAETELAFKEIMSHPAIWCPTLPVAVEVDSADHYE